MNERHIDDDRLMTICKVGQPGNVCCRFVICGAKGFECAKHTELAAMINRRVANNDFNARGDNCPGLPLEPGGSGDVQGSS